MTSGPPGNPMCNIYQFKNRKQASEGFRTKVMEASRGLGSEVTRKTDPGVVVRAGGEVVVMRWGFRRDVNPAVNNARADKLDGGMWGEAVRHRRCVIPVTAFWEWGPGAGGRKHAHLIRDAEEDWLWMAGLWEDSADLGPCYSMVTTAASVAMAGLHDRMPAILRREEANGWLKGTFRPGRPYDGALVLEPCASPLAGGSGDNPGAGVGILRDFMLASSCPNRVASRC